MGTWVLGKPVRAEGQPGLCPVVRLQPISIEIADRIDGEDGRMRLWSLIGNVIHFSGNIVFMQLLLLALMLFFGMWCKPTLL